LTDENLRAATGALFGWKAALLVAIVLASVFAYRAFCRFLCPLGAIYSLFNKFALFGIKVNERH
jgi:polyferredoxin